MSASAASPQPDGLLLRVRLTPNARTEDVEGERRLADGMAVLAVKVRAIPEDGAANRALEALIARRCGVARGSVAVVSGQTRRIKVVRVAGEPAALLRRLGLAAPPPQAPGRAAP